MTDVRELIESVTPRTDITGDRGALADIVHAWLCRDPSMESPATLADDILASAFIREKQAEAWDEGCNEAIDSIEENRFIPPNPYGKTEASRES